MAVIRVGISAALGMLVTFALIILMYKLIDSGSKELDEGAMIKIHLLLIVLNFSLVAVK